METVFFEAPKDQVPNFVPRPSLHQQLENAFRPKPLSKSSRPRIAVVHGRAGTGKSQLVANFIEEARDRYAGVFWLDARRRDTIDEHLRRLDCLLSNENEPKVQVIANLEELVNSACHWFNQRSDKKFLLVYDGADNLGNGDRSSTVDLNALIPQCRNLDILITSRDSAVAKLGSTVIPMTDMEEGEAIELLLQNSGLNQSAVSRKQLQDTQIMVEILGYRPLLVTLAGSYIAQNPKIQSHLAQYLPEFRRNRKKVVRDYRGLIPKFPAASLAIWETSLELAAEKSPLAVRMLTFLSFLDPRDISSDLFEDGTHVHLFSFAEALDSANDEGSADSSSSTEDGIVEGDPDSTEDDQESARDLPILAISDQERSDIQHAFSVLESLSFLRRSAQGSRFRMENLIYSWNQERLSQDEKALAVKVTSEFLMDKIRRNSEASTSEKRYLGSQMMANFDNIARLREDLTDPELQSMLVSSLDTFADQLSEMGRGLDEISVRQLCYDMSEQVYGTDHMETLAVKRYLAKAFWAAGDLTQAATLEREVLEKMTAILGNEDTRTLEVINDLALSLQALGDPKGAASLLRELLERRTKLHGNSHPDTLQAMNNLASILIDAGALTEAVAIATQALDLRKQVLGEEHLDTLTTMSNLAGIHRALGEFDQAATMYRQVLLKRKQILGRENPATLTAMNNLAAILMGTGEVEEAVSLQLEVLEMRKKTQGKDHPDTLKAVVNLASSLYAMEELEAAAALQQDVLNKRRQILGDAHPDTLRLMGNLANTLFAQGHHDQAIDLLTESVEQSKITLGDDHFETIQSMENLKAMQDQHNLPLRDITNLLC
ncbi:uncharacterized protein Z519_09715 [Cladophialophora bantiana CBS 173.52]|uniref:AAA+ ATPase domain-containing protein n=1 Tax=Cladophialophora bantiana (strain ATCC 10958 / CBS 173.52 / CDC B-1940 / NIH 8579) TaxID=1442370 RepID=A0A0D2HYC9_CLAB1|nr:uncharacterized protein Z519_09715 [Cladophialophora bantiana CBS 173.52]KIW89559.1 hypothetical protein Z519_09715 [Cladophialophora bantiana CBS 173.52]